ncbi:hypothetical protein Esi_0324_0019 [Ectocarpus siliculosus]|uniref:Uncharacterized protein n=1 Tax=Ectocarpus siliculosus TaxID=2880 RepID=D7FXC4_ECTSI|nr:hypothetical protein Esi_0324_0019 [Ectocarpus siliculosus]|eukprot:CBJ32261.1 hypothetical protein Esi_0324_0019 [Ectocarpus siliculosus]
MVKLTYSPTETMYADCLTKNLPKATFIRLLELSQSHGTRHEESKKALRDKSDKGKENYRAISVNESNVCDTASCVKTFFRRTKIFRAEFHSANYGAHVHTDEYSIHERQHHPAEQRDGGT